VGAAVNERDPLMRIAYVAAFAMSNYSSTFGRIAKPFNPMLVRENVSHDVRSPKLTKFRAKLLNTWISNSNTDTSPNKSATTLQFQHVGPSHPLGGTMERYSSMRCDVCILLTRAIAKVDAQNKFMGRSFEIRPTGIAHAELILNEDWAPDYPKDKHPRNVGKVVEHYSWKKVVTNISGFMLGAPTIDHYGEMIVRYALLPVLLSPDVHESHRSQTTVLRISVD